MTDAQDGSDVARITIQPIDGALIASIQADLDERVLLQFQSDLLQRVAASRARVVIIDLTAVDVMDGSDFAGLRRTIGMVALMGTETILCGVQPGVAASLVDANAACEGLRFRLNLDAALAELAAPGSRALETAGGGAAHDAGIDGRQ